MLILVSVETELILAVKLLFFYPWEDSLVFILDMHNFHGQNLSQDPQFLSLVPVRVRVGYLTSEVMNMIPILKARVSGVVLPIIQAKPLPFPTIFFSWSLKKMSANIWFKSYLECSKERKIKREFWFQAYSVHLNSKMLYSLHDCKFQTSLAEW